MNSDTFPYVWQNGYRLQTESYTVHRCLLTWLTVAHQFRKSPAVDNCAQPVDNTPYCATALPAEHVRVPSGLFGRRSYFVELISRHTLLLAPTP